jgi:hypothetical protein
MAQHWQVFKLKTRGADGKPPWAYRYPVDGRGSARPQVGGFASQGEALQGLQVVLERLCRRKGRLAHIKLSELVEEYLAQHEAEPRTIAKLRRRGRTPPRRRAATARAARPFHRGRYLDDPDWDLPRERGQSAPARTRRSVWPAPVTT